MKSIRALFAAAAIGCFALTIAAALPATAAAQAPSDRQVALYRDLMEANGVAHNARQAVAAMRAAVAQSAVERKGSPLTSAEQTRLDAVTASVFSAELENVLNDIARTQSTGFTEAEISELITVNQSPAAVRYNAARFEGADTEGAEIQNYMVDAVVASINTYNAGAAPTPAAANPSDADTALIQRIALARSLLEADGTAETAISFVRKNHRILIAREINKHIEVNTLPAEDRARLTTIINAELATLTDRILQLSAVRYAQTFSRAELAGLIAAYDIEAQRKLTAMRISDDGSLDRRAEAALQAATQRALTTFESGS
ncbi:hypothetical protein [Brevundimonas sp.]|uniref:hypothetical protein n=1 Tax=Brevundimonas sp. TaxID=1871086 RepID=UPI002FDA1344